MADMPAEEPAFKRGRVAPGYPFTWQLLWVARILFVLFLCVIVGAALPLNVLDPTWQLSVFSAVVNTSGYPLVGMGLLHLAADLDHSNELLHNQRRLCARLAVPVALGFVLMVPLQSFLLWQQNSTTIAGQEAQLTRRERSLSDLRQAVDAATSTADLQKRLQALNRPPLSAAEQAMPLQMLKLQAKAALKQSASALRRGREGLPRGDIFSLIQISLHNSVACLALALGFAALAKRRHSNVPLLQEWQGGWDHWQWRKRQQRATRRGGSSDQHYIRQLCGEERDS